MTPGDWGRGGGKATSGSLPWSWGGTEGLALEERKKSEYTRLPASLAYLWFPAMAASLAGHPKLFFASVHKYISTKLFLMIAEF
jgi:hypothetical protein